MAPLTVSKKKGMISFAAFLLISIIIVTKQYRKLVAPFMIHMIETEEASFQTISTSSSSSSSSSQSAALPIPVEVDKINTTTTMIMNIHHDEECSCMNSTAPIDCCWRAFHVAHKMGFDVVKNIVRSLRHTSLPKGTIGYSEGSRISLTEFKSPPGENIKGRSMIAPKIHPRKKNQDYREVSLIRNIYDALASGYLYHITGRECHLGPNGEPWKNKVPRLLQFEPYISVDHVPPVGNRSMCQYLAEESEEIGFRVYSNWAFTIYYDIILEGYKFSQSNGYTKQRSKYICFEDITTFHKDDEILNDIMNFFFPGGRNEPYNGFRPGAKTYTGGHSTSHDPELRKRLKQHAIRMDQQYFNGKIAQFEQFFSCSYKN